MSRVRDKDRSAVVDPAQLGLFDARPETAPTPAKAFPPPPVTHRVRPARRREAIVDVIEAGDLPLYPADLVLSIKESIRSIPTDRVLLTYKEIWDYFGVSRATVIRRMRDGLVPGVRLENGRVLDEGPIRRLSREQVSWLLLAVRSRR